MRVALLQGGRSFERSVSLRSGARVEDALERRGHDVVAIDVSAALVRELRECAPQVAFVALHGAEGEDGSVQELLELLGIPYTGSGPSACLRCWDKALTKYAALDAGLPTPDFVTFDQSTFADLGVGDALTAIEDRLDFPLVVKPARQGSALGIKLAHGPQEIPPALVAAFSYDTRVLLERHAPGRELAVSVVDGPDGPQVLPVVEAVPESREIYDFAARYSIGQTRFVCPAELPGGVTERVTEIAAAVYRLLGCRGFARVDFMCDDGEPQLLEVNAIPGLTETSLLPIAADAAGIDFDDLVERLVQGALNVSRVSAR